METLLEDKRVDPNLTSSNNAGDCCPCSILRQCKALMAAYYFLLRANFLSAAMGDGGWKDYKISPLRGLQTDDLLSITG
ncbi:hypothetical protein [Cardinium endosymbiont of Nabis limbatus]|uniref:hypothetical protein n=1 Tax=Cardinium endosymbiont of Nabis limbatus TaxID=3066217 RepID=UPI003AF3702D